VPTMLTKKQIIDEIRRTAKENGGIPLGTSRFKKETGVKTYDWQNYWARFGDAQKEAGFVPNKLQQAYDEDFIMGKIIDLTRKLNKIPTILEFRVAKNDDSKMPSKNAIARLGGNKFELSQNILKYCNDKKGYEDVIKICGSIIGNSKEKGGFREKILGEVYLFKSGKYYKIGKTNDTVRRGSELKIQLPENLDLIHSIRTDDPSGIEAYWHKRFELKRMNGEWFDLDSSDIKSFKSWRKIY